MPTDGAGKNFLFSFQDFFRVPIVFFDILEVVNGTNFHLNSCGVIADNDSVRMELEAGEGPHMVYAELDGLLECMCLVVSADDNHNSFCIHYSRNTDGEGGFGNLVNIATEETGISNNSIFGESFYSGTACERGAGLVEGDVTIGPNSTNEEFDAAVLFDLSFVAVAFGLEVFGIAVEDVDVRFFDVYVAEEVGPHERVVALRVLFGDADVFIHVESYDVGEIDFFELV